MGTGDNIEIPSLRGILHNQSWDLPLEEKRKRKKKKTKHMISLRT